MLEFLGPYIRYKDNDDMASLFWRTRSLWGPLSGLYSLEFGQNRGAHIVQSF